MPYVFVVFDVLGMEGLTVNRAELAQIMQVSMPTIDAWRADGCPVASEGSNGKAYVFEVEAVKAWRAEKIQAARVAEEERAAELAAATSQLDLLSGAGGEAHGVDSLPLKLRKEFYEAEARRMDLARRRGQLVEVIEVEQQFEQVFALLADQLQTLPDHLERTAGLDPATVDLIVEKINEWQGDLAGQVSRENFGKPVNETA